MANVLEFGAKGDGKIDDTDAIRHAIAKGDGHVVLPRGEYLITKTIDVPLDQYGPLTITGEGGLARILMANPGPAFHLVGTHQKTALPADFDDKVWRRQRMPTLTGLEIVGAHPDADGIRVEGAMQTILHGLLIRKCNNGVHLTKRDRNVIISDCHIYNNSGIGVFLDKVNLHQTNIHGNHISYCKRGGIVVRESEVRNIQICSNDIEYNHDLEAKTSNDILFDCTDGTVREGAIVGNTIQAVLSPGGANIRLLGAKDHPNAVGLLAITGNLIGSQETAIHMRAARGVTISGNSIYSGYHNAIWAEDCETIVIGANSIDHNPEYKGKSTDRVLLERCRNVTMTGVMLQHTKESVIDVESSVTLDGCENVSVTGCQIVGARVRGVDVKGGSVVRIADCTIRARDGDEAYRVPIRVDGKAKQVLVLNNFLAKGKDGELQLPDGSGKASGNVAL